MSVYREVHVTDAEDRTVRVEYSGDDCEWSSSVLIRADRLATTIRVGDVTLVVGGRESAFHARLEFLKLPEREVRVLWEGNYTEPVAAPPYQGEPS